MRIGLISDTHNQHDKIVLVAQRFQVEGIRIVLHGGDITTPESLEPLRDFDVWLAWGNMDRHAGLPDAAATLFGAGRLAPLHELTLNGYAIALLHGNDEALLQQVITSKRYAYVIHGHTHVFHDTRHGPTRVINPGALGNTGWRAPSYALLDLATGALQYRRL